MSRLPVLPISESNIGVKGFHPLCMVLLEQIPPGIFNWEAGGDGQWRELRFTACRVAWLTAVSFGTCALTLASSTPTRSAAAADSEESQAGGAAQLTPPPPRP